MTINAATIAPPPNAAAVPIVLEAIVRRQCIAATYNRGRVTLAPHVLYTRHDELYLDATTIERDGKPPREEKVGTFKLAGLDPLRLTGKAFQTSALFEREAEKYAGVSLMMVEAA